jgi:nucleoside-diphosphate-sugar epimerase
VGVNGRPGILGIDENTPTQVASERDYHSSKAAGENLTLARSDDMEAVVIRPTITYGPGDADGMVTKLIQMIAAHRYFRIGNGENHIHLTYIDDLLQGLHLAMTHKGAPGKTFILAGPAPTRINTILQLVETHMQMQLPKWQIPARFARFTGAVCEEIFGILPNNWEPPITRDKVDNLCVNRGFSWEKAALELSYQPQYSIEPGLRQTIEWLSSH